MFFVRLCVYVEKPDKKIYELEHVRGGSPNFSRDNVKCLGITVAWLSMMLRNPKPYLFQSVNKNTSTK